MIAARNTFVRRMVLSTLATSLAIPGSLFALRPAVAQDPPANLYEVAVGRRLEAYRKDGTRIPATSTRFFPGELNVHKGDVIRFHSDIFLMLVVLLPPPWTPTTDPDDAFAWQSEKNNLSHDYDDPWFLVNYDPDDDRPGDLPHTKVNLRAAIPPLHCGHSPETACPFPRPGSTGHPVDDVLTSGSSEKSARTLGPNPYPTNLFVKVQADPGTTFWATLLSALGTDMKINVVPADQPATEPGSLKAAMDAQVAVDTARVEELDAQYANYSVRTKIAPGVHRHEALAGIEQDGVTILQSYPRQLRIKPGDSVVWRADLLPGQFHTVSFPRLPSLNVEWPANIVEHFTAQATPAIRPPLYRYACDLDTDQGRGPDAPQLMPWPLFCPGFTSQLEVEFPNEIVYPSGDGRYTAGDDQEHSGIVGASPPPAPGGRPFEVSFPVASPEGGFRYQCLLHPVMDASVIVR